jgi:hypothetical protein
MNGFSAPGTDHDADGAAEVLTPLEADLQRLFPDRPDFARVARLRARADMAQGGAPLKEELAAALTSVTEMINPDVS